MKEKIKNARGITLIALIVTIIVLIILAGISVNLLIGDNGIITRAKDAAVEQAVGQIKEAVRLALTTEYVKQQGDTSKMTVQGVLEELRSSLNSNVIYAKKGNTTINTLAGKNLIDESVSFYFPAEINGSANKEIVVTVDGNLNVTGASSSETQSQSTGTTVQALAQAGTIQRWDTINYNPGSATTASLNLPKGASIEGTKVAALNLPDGAELGGTISASDASDWVVLDVNTTTGEVLIMPRTVSDVTLTLSGIDGYNNAIEALDMVAGIYLNPAYATSARSIRLEDIVKDENTTIYFQEENVEKSWAHRYGMNSSNLKITDTGDDSDTPTQTYYEGNCRGYVAPSFSGVDAYVASQLTIVYDETHTLNTPDYNCEFNIYHLAGKYVNAGGRNLVKIFSDGTIRTDNINYLVLPVVTLKPNIKLQPTSQFYTETATATTPVEEETEFVHNAWSIVQ